MGKLHYYIIKSEKQKNSTIFTLWNWKSTINSVNLLCFERKLREINASSKCWTRNSSNWLLCLFSNFLNHTFTEILSNQSTFCFIYIHCSLNHSYLLTKNSWNHFICTFSKFRKINSKVQSLKIIGLVSNLRKFDQDVFSKTLHFPFCFHFDLGGTASENSLADHESLRSTARVRSLRH